jgi:hypothetical protein
MQPLIMDIKFYEYDNSKDQMYYYQTEGDKKGHKLLVAGDEFEGLGLSKKQVLAHIRELRSLGYQILSTLTLGNTKSSAFLMTNLPQSGLTGPVAPKLNEQLI